MIDEENFAFAKTGTLQSKGNYAMNELKSLSLRQPPTGWKGAWADG
jgi:hypothetical protein